MVTYEDLLQRQIIKKIETVEKERYISYHQSNYTLDLESAVKFLDIQNAKYAVIAGYYSVLNSTLWYFAKYFNLKISEEDTGVHTNCLIVLEKFIKEERLKKKIIELLQEARKEFASFVVIKKRSEETLPLVLKQSSEKRKRYTYYSAERNLPKINDPLNEARTFIDYTVKPYISIMEKLKC